MSGGLHKAASSGELFGGNSNSDHYRGEPIIQLSASATMPRGGLAPLKLNGDVNRNTLAKHSHEENSRKMKAGGFEDETLKHSKGGGKKSFWLTLRDKFNPSRSTTSYSSYDLTSGKGSVEIPNSSMVTYTATITSKDSGISSELGDSVPSTPVSSTYDKIPGICGIHNLGNTCYMNAVLQCLAHVDTVVEYFALDEYKDELKHLKKKSKKLESKGEITERLASIMKSLWSDGYSKELCQEFKDTVEKYGQQYGGSEQHDAQEFFLWLLDIVHEELSKAQKLGKKKQSTIKHKKKHATDEEQAAYTLAAHTRDSKSFIQNLFQAQYRSSLTCPNPSCGMQSSTFDPFMTISLPIPQQPTLAIFVTIVFQLRERIPVKIGLSMAVESNCKEFIATVARYVQLPSSALILAKVGDNGDQHVFGEADSIMQISEADQQVYAFEVPDIAYVNSVQKASNNGSAQTTEFCSVSDRAQTNGGKKDEASDMPSNTLLLIVTNVEIHDRRCYRFGYPIIIRVSRELKFKDLQILIRRELPTEIRDSINGLAKSSRLSFGMRIVEGFPGRDYLSNDVDCPLYQDSVDRALACCAEEKHTYVSVVAEWESDRTWSLAKFGVFEPNEHASVKRVQQQYQKSYEVDLEKCLHMHTEDEELQCDDAWTCPNCKKEQTGTIKKLELWSLPDVLVFHLKRFQQANQWKGKISTLIKFPLESLDLTPHVARRKPNASPRLLRRASKKNKARNQVHKNPEDSIYDLFAVCDHIGPYMTSGHYTACCKNSADGNWYSFDDAVVKPIDKVDVVKKSAYLLFYQRRTLLPRYGSLTSISTTSSNHWAQRISRASTPEKSRKEFQVI